MINETLLSVSHNTFQLECGRVLLLLCSVQLLHQPVEGVHDARLDSRVHSGGLQDRGDGHHELGELRDLLRGAGAGARAESCAGLRRVVRFLV